MDRTRIAVIHATHASTTPVADAFARGWSDAEVTNILDDGLSRDRQRQRHLTDSLRKRIQSLATYAYDCGADAVLFACSAFGEAIDEAARQIPIPILKPNEAMFRAAIAYGDDLALLVTFEPAGPAMAAEFEELGELKNHSVQLTTVYVPDALDALHRGDSATHDSLIASAAGEVSGASAILLGQFSMASAAVACAQATGTPVLTSPDAAVRQLRALLHKN